MGSYLKIMHELGICQVYVTKTSLIEIFTKSVHKSLDYMTLE